MEALRTQATLAQSCACGHSGTLGDGMNARHARSFLPGVSDNGGEARKQPGSSALEGFDARRCTASLIPSTPPPISNRAKSAESASESPIRIQVLPETTCG